MVIQQLLQLGLTTTQAKAMAFLLENGEKKAVEIAKSTKQPRGVVYKALEELLKLELIEKIEEPRMVARFRPAHPRALERLMHEKKLQIKQQERMFEEALPGLVSLYNLSMHRPGVKFYEGKEGFVKILEDTLQSKTEVYLFINTQEFSTESLFQEINNEYRSKRQRRGVYKKVIRTGMRPVDFKNPDQYTEIRYLGQESAPFKSSIQIYDNKISYQILEAGQAVAVLVEDKNIYQMHKTFFEYVWDKLEDAAK